MSKEKKMIVRNLGFGGLMHIPPLRVHHQILRELANSFKLGENRLETGYDSFKIRQKTIGSALVINASGDLFPQKVNYKDLSEDDKQIFRRFQGKTFKNLTDEMMDIGIDKKRAERPLEPWIANWSKEQLVERMRAEIEKNMSKKRKNNQEDSDSESESTDESEESSPVKKQKTKKKKKVIVEDSSPEQAQSYHGSEIGSEDLDELLRENNENSAAQGEKEADMRSTEGHYVSSEIIPDVNLGSDDPSSQGHTEQSSVNKPAESMLSLVEESASEPVDSNMMVVREETPSEGLAIVSIQVCLPLFQTTTMPKIEETPETENEPTPLLQIEGTTKTNPAPEDVAALMMMARTASYVPKTDLMPSFSLGFTDSSQEETTTQEGASTQDEHRVKTPETPKLLEQLENLVHKIAIGEVTKKEKSSQIPKESGAESFEKFETPVRTNENSSDMKEKCYLWAIRVITYADGLTDEFDNVCRLQAQDIYTLSKLHLASLAPKTHIEAENMPLANHPQGVFLQPKNNKPFRMEDYPMFIPFLDLQKLKSHRYIFAPVCHSQHWWLWFADTRKRKFYIVDPYHTKSPSDERTALNTFVYMLGGTSEIKGQGQGNCSTIPSHLGPKGKWLEIFEPTNIKRWKYEWDNWTQDEVDHFRVEYASRILFYDMNLDKAEAIRGSNAIRLSKPSSLLSSPYCQIDSEDVDTA
ncbi:uncharacterized protein DS421_19g668280 [Arachis hypogaea]|uniref:Ubiquitin-like protease family profile domain-containing protein n=1 Tax=Arachis hypogaea TaxID=3818 RepID=A0A6B9VDL8_ARAHY|nr:uncharacterized protein DS421_19g668280 [Arachis hypogaea]